MCMKRSLLSCETPIRTPDLHANVARMLIGPEGVILQLLHADIGSSSANVSEDTQIADIAGEKWRHSDSVKGAVECKGGI